MRTNLLLAFILSLSGAAALAVLLERVDTTIRSPQDVLNAVNLPTMAVIPAEGARSRQLAWVSMDSPWANAFRGLRASLTATGLGSTYHSLLLTSETGGVGKSLVAANLAVAYANAGFKVMLIDLDLIRPTQHQLFGVSNDTGIASELSAQSNVIPMQATEFENLSLVPAGLTDTNPDDILALGLPDDLLRTAYQQAEIVIVDGPALSDSAAAMVLPRNLDAALVVVAGGESTQAELRRVVERLEVAPASILGVVINRSAQRLRRLKSSKRGGVRPLRRGDAPPRPRTPQIDIDDAGVAMSTRRTNNGSGRSPRRRTPRSDEPTSMTPALNPVNNEE
jgi:capsular exopolysaccharide synthesis family protein